jgi:methyl-accepting chemotaxis protein
MNALDNLRAKASVGIFALLWVNVAIILLRNFLRPEGFSTAAVVGALLVAASATASWLQSRTGATTRVVVSMAHAATVALLVYSFAGSPLQIDMHMYFFASLAICAAWIDWRAIVGYAGLVAVHHLLFYFAMPLAVFPGESDFSRVVLHAVVLILQSGVLIALTHSVVAAFTAADTALGEARTAHQNATDMTERARATDMQAEEERRRREAEKLAEAEEIRVVVSELDRALSELSSGNLAFRIQHAFRGELDSLRISFNGSLENLELVLAKVGHTAQSVRAGAGQISHANGDLQNRTEQQAASVQETAASLSQVNGTVQETTRLAEQAGQLVDHARRNAERSGSVVTDAVEAMSRIATSSAAISQIISVIDEIAFQTNLLALNAGVEAARAGDAGKGFAVVAQEVRELAQRSANSAREIRTLIGASSEHIQTGVGLVGQAGEALTSIAREVQEISAHVNGIIRGAREQASGLGEISSAITQIDRNTQQNAGMVEESASAIDVLAGEAEALEGMLSRFRFADAGQWQAGRRRAA